MDWSTLSSWFLIALLTAAFIIHRSRKKTATAAPESIEGILHHSYTTPLADTELRTAIEQTLQQAGFTLHSSTEQRLIYDSNTIGLFHWGFLYLIDFPSSPSQTVTFSIFGKGPNPPHRKAMQKHMDTFLHLMQDIPLEAVHFHNR